jgi:ferritin|tara:strand:+ start:100 stop:588 length:489 start_codon:yes stop_codon:yes gene_type:complete
MLSKSMAKMINDQIADEFNAAYLYLSMSAYCETIGFLGFSKWLRKQSKEEIGHGMKLIDYMNDQTTKVVLQQIYEPEKTFGSLTDMMEQALLHEQEISECINKLCNQATAEEDHTTRTMLDWFVTEQLEEEKSVGDVVEQLRIFGETRSTLYNINMELGLRE